MMAPQQSVGSLVDVHVGPHPSYIKVAKPYIFEQRLEESIAGTGANSAKEVAARLQGVAWIDNVRRSLHL